MKVKTRKRYTPEFKAQVLELLQLGKSVPEVAQDFDLSSDLVYRWRRTQSQLAQLQLENDILKKAAVILGTDLPAKREK